MKLKSIQKDWKDTWLQTAVSVVALVFVLLTSFGVITPEQSTQAQPQVQGILQAVAEIITGGVALWGILFKASA